MSVKAEDARRRRAGCDTFKFGRLRRLQGRAAAGRPASAVAAPARRPPPGGRRCRDGNRVRLERPRGVRARGRASRSSRRASRRRAQHRRRRDKYLASAGVAPGQPVVRELRDLVARAVGPQDGRRRLGGGADVGARRGGGHERPLGRQPRGRPPRRHRRLRLGRPGGLRLGRPHRLPGEQGRGRQVHRPGGQLPGRGAQRAAADGRRQRQVPADQRRGLGGCAEADGDPARRADRPRAGAGGLGRGRPVRIRRRHHAAGRRRGGAAADAATPANAAPAAAARRRHPPPPSIPPPWRRQRPRQRATPLEARRGDSGQFMSVKAEDAPRSTAPR